MAAMAVDTVEYSMRCLATKQSFNASLEHGLHLVRYTNGRVGLVCNSPFKEGRKCSRFVSEETAKQFTEQTGIAAVDAPAKKSE